MKQEDVFVPEETPINDSGILYKTQFLVLSRTMLEAMPVDWQKRFLLVLSEIGEEFNYEHPEWVEEEFYVRNRDPNTGKFVSNPWGDYKYPKISYIEKVRNKRDSSPATPTGEKGVEELSVECNHEYEPQFQDDGFTGYSICRYCEKTKVGR